MIEKRYLGDGVYAAVEKGTVKLTTENDLETTNVIFLELAVLIQFNKFTEDALGATLKEI